MSAEKNVCRVCLAGIIKLNYLNDNLLINLYEKLSESKLNSEDARPKALCCLCYQKLLGCHTFSQMAHRSEKIFSQVFNKGLETTPEDITELNLGIEYHMSVTQLTMDDRINESSVTFEDQPISVKEEVTLEEDPLVKVKSAEDCSKNESSFHQTKTTPEDITELNLGIEYHMSVTQLTMDDRINESSVTFKDQPISVKEEVTLEEDPLVKVKSAEDCSKNESSFHQTKHFTRPHVYRKRKYIRKNPEAAPMSEATFKEAQKLIKDGKSQRSAAAAVGISEACLRYRLKRGTVAYSMGRFKPTFNIEQEIEFVKHCKDMDDRFFGVTINNLRKLAYEYAEANKIENRFDRSSRMAGRNWVYGFLERNPQLAVRRS